MAFTNEAVVVQVLVEHAAVGRFGPPEPLRDVSISIPIVLGKPAETRLEYIASS